MNILIVCNSSHHSKNAIDLVESLVDRDPRLRVIALCEAKDLQTYSKMINPKKTRLMSPDAKAHQESQLVSAALQVNDRIQFPKLLRLIRESTLVSLLREKKSKAYLRNRISQIEKIFDEVQPTAVLSFGDRHIDIEAPVFVVAKSRGVKIVIPYGTYSGPEGLIKLRQIQGEPKRWTPFSLYRLYANFRLKDQIRDGFFYQPPTISFAMKALGALSRNPWCIGNGLSDVVCVDCEHTSQRYQKEMVPAKKIHVVGDLAYDSLFEQYSRKDQLRQDILKEYGFSADKKTIIFALPQFYEQGIMGADEHWKEIRFLMEQVSKTGHNILLSLHPRCNPAEYAFLEKDFPARISKQPLKEILPMADLFLAINSSTVFWAVLCGIPAVVINFYGLTVQQYAHLKTVKLASKRESFLEALKEAFATSNHDFQEDWKSLSRKQVFDGQTMNRYHRILVSGHL